MIKLFAAGLWSIALVVGSFWFFSAGAIERNEGSDPKALKKVLEVVEFDTIAVSLFEADRVAGYMIMDLAAEVDRKAAPTGDALLELQLRSELIAILQSEPSLSIGDFKQIDTIALQDQIVGQLNEKAGASYVASVLITNLDYLSREEVRDLKLRRQ